MESFIHKAVENLASSKGLFSIIGLMYQIERYEYQERMAMLVQKRSNTPMIRIVYKTTPSDNKS